MRLFRILGLLTLAVTVVVSTASASTINYVFTGTVSGVVGSTSFSGASFTLTATADTSSIYSPFTGAYNVNPSSVLIDIAGIGSMNLLNNSYVFDAQDGVAGFGVQSIPVCCDIIQIYDPAFQTYDLSTAIGPI